MDMRVFDSYGFNIIDKVRFGQTKPYLEKMLSELGYTYSNFGFSLQSHIDTPLCEKVIQKFPSLQKYNYIIDRWSHLSSFSENWHKGELHANPADWDDISMVFSKIPRTFNFPFGKLILDGINWYKDCNNTVAINYRHHQTTRPTSTNPPFKSNRIIQFRNYDDGMKHNTIWICIEATAEPEPRNTIEIIERLKPYLGEPNWHTRDCTLQQEEYERIMPLEEKHKNNLKFLSAEMLPIPRQRTYHEDVSVTHVTDKSTLTKAFANTEFQRKDDMPLWLKLYYCIDTHGFYYKAFIQKLSGGPEFRLSLEIDGYNFHIEFDRPDYFVVKNGESLEILKEFAAFCVKVRDEYGAELAKDFGDTPLWYWKKFV